MLISFSVENWMSFRNRATLSMVASKEKQHQERLTRIPNSKMRLSPVSAMYGANASGKSNFCKALAFMQELVVKGNALNAPIKVAPFVFDRLCRERPSFFQIAILVGEKCYEFGFSATRSGVVEEWLTEFIGTKERQLYKRDATGVSGECVETSERMRFIAEGTRKNQLFLTNTIDQNAEEFKHIHSWFKNTLRVITPDSHFLHFLDTEEKVSLYELVGQYLKELDTGIERLEWREQKIDSLGFPKEVAAEMEALADGEQMVLSTSSGDELYLFKESQKLVAKRLRAAHKDITGDTHYFPMVEESDGSRRLVDLLPAFLSLFYEDAPRVYFVDEFDRSLHTLLTRHLLQNYLHQCGEATRAQFLFTTHDVLLMDQHILRRDEMWITERMEDGGTTLTSFGEFKDIRYDKDIRRSYLQGRLGGIPHILFWETVHED